MAANQRKVKSVFLTQINILIDWRPVSTLINRAYKRGANAVGRPSYPGLILFKMTLLQTWYGLNDYEIEEQVNDRISFSRFVGISMGDSVPDHSVISRFRSEMTTTKTYDKLLVKINNQLKKHNILITGGTIVDASITDSPRIPHSRKQYDIVEDRHEEDDNHDKPSGVFLQQKYPARVDKEAGWT